MKTLALMAMMALLAGFPVRGAQAVVVPQKLTLDQAVQEALAHNPRLAALGHTRDAMQERPGQARGLPNPMFTYRGMDATSGGTFPNTSEKRFELEQPLPGYGKRGLREAVALNEAGAMGAETEAMAREVVLMVKEAAFELQALQKALAITREEETVLTRMAKVVETRYSTGEAAQTDVIKAQTEITMLKQKKVELEGREKTLKAKLAMLMNRDSSQSLGPLEAPIPDGAVPDWKSKIEQALKNRPEMKSAQFKVARGDLQRQLMGRESQPDYKVGLEYRSVERGDDMVMFMAGVDLPLWQGKNRAAVREAGMMVAASQSSREAMERQVTLDLQEACYKLEAAKRSLDLYQKELIPQSGVRLQSSEAGYRAGKVDFMDWLESARLQLNVRIRAAMAEGEVGSGWATLEWATGGSL